MLPSSGNVHEMQRLIQDVGRIQASTRGGSGLMDGGGGLVGAETNAGVRDSLQPMPMPSTLQPQQHGGASSVSEAGGVGRGALPTTDGFASAAGSGGGGGARPRDDRRRRPADREAYRSDDVRGMAPRGERGTGASGAGDGRSRHHDRDAGRDRDRKPRAAGEVDGGRDPRPRVGGESGNKDSDTRNEWVRSSRSSRERDPVGNADRTRRAPMVHESVSGAASASKPYPTGGSSSQRSSGSGASGTGAVSAPLGSSGRSSAYLREDRVRADATDRPEEEDGDESEAIGDRDTDEGDEDEHDDDGELEAGEDGSNVQDDDEYDQEYEEDEKGHASAREHGRGSPSDRVQMRRRSPRLPAPVMRGRPDAGAAASLPVFDPYRSDQPSVAALREQPFMDLGGGAAEPSEDQWMMRSQSTLMRTTALLNLVRPDRDLNPKNLEQFLRLLPTVPLHEQQAKDILLQLARNFLVIVKELDERVKTCEYNLAAFGGEPDNQVVREQRQAMLEHERRHQERLGHGLSPSPAQKPVPNGGVHSNDPFPAPYYVGDGYAQPPPLAGSSPSAAEPAATGPKSTAPSQASANGTSKQQPPFSVPPPTALSQSTGGLRGPYFTAAATTPSASPGPVTSSPQAEAYARSPAATNGSPSSAAPAVAATTGGGPISGPSTTAVRRAAPGGGAGSVRPGGVGQATPAMTTSGAPSLTPARASGPAQHPTAAPSHTGNPAVAEAPAPTSAPGTGGVH